MTTKVPAELVSDQVFGRRNLVVNGAMRVAQRGTSATGVTTSGYRTCDRWNIAMSVAGTWTETQSTDAPDGFANSLKLECTTANTSLAAGSLLYSRQMFEGQDLQKLKKGTSSAQSLTVSFWVKSNKTGTYHVGFQDSDNTRLRGEAYTINSSGTWEHKTITMEGDTTGTLDNDANTSLQLHFWLAAGSNFVDGGGSGSWAATQNANYADNLDVNLADTVGNYWQITGVQLEAGDNATPFEHLTYGEEFTNCSRYFQVIGFQEDAFGAYSVSTTRGFVSLPMLPMRGNPTGALSNLETRYFSSANDNSWNSTSGTVFILGSTSFQYNASAVVIPTIAITVDYAGDRTDVFGLIRGKLTLDAEL